MKRKRHTEEQKGPRSPRVDTTFSPEKTQPEFERGSWKSLTLQFSTKVSSWKGNHLFGLQSAVMTAQAQVFDNLPITEAEKSFALRGGARMAEGEPTASNWQSFHPN